MDGEDNVMPQGEEEKKDMPMEEAAPVALRVVVQFLRAHPEIEEVRFVLRSPDALRIFEQAATKVV